MRLGAENMNAVFHLGETLIRLAAKNMNEVFQLSTHLTAWAVQCFSLLDKVLQRRIKIYFLQKFSLFFTHAGFLFIDENDNDDNDDHTD